MILCYHSVDPRWQSNLSMSPERFEQHCAWLARRKTVVPLSTVSSQLDRSCRLPAGATAITFDDGYRDVLRYAAPILGRHGLTATVFVVAASLTEGFGGVDWVDDPPGHRLEVLDKDEILQLRQAGIEIGSHSYRHADLTTLSQREVVEDLRASREVLEDLLREPVTMLAYPRGRHDERVRDAAHRAGYDVAFTLEAPGPIGRHAVPRVGVSPLDGPAALSIKTARSYLPLRRSRLGEPLRTLTRRLSANGH